MRLPLFLAAWLVTTVMAGYTSPVLTSIAVLESSPQVCGDLLQKYAAKPVGLTLIGCTEGKPGGQTVAIATYRVAGANAATAEKFFHEKYGMGNLKYACCGWEPENGEQGQVESVVLKKLNPNYSLLITMHSDAQAMEKAMMSGNPSTWRDKRKVTYFIIEARVVDV